MQLSKEQKEILEEYLKNFLNSPIIKDKNIEISYSNFDKTRINAIPRLKEMVDEFLENKSSLIEFKERSESLSRELPYWGFKGFGGQMQLNQYVNNIKDNDKDNHLKEAIKVPKTLEEAVEKINKTAEYLSEIKTKVDNPKSIPRINQGFMLSYFWEIQSPEKYPVFFAASKKALEGIGFDFESQETAGEKYKDFVEVYKEISSLFKNESKEHPFWFVEHVLWKQFKEEEGSTIETVKKREIKTSGSIKPTGEAWIPSIIGDLEYLARNKETEWSKEKRVSPERAFEIKLRYLFTILGYNVMELGQGKGREPDGIAISTDGHSGYYAVIYDAKAREKEYSIGTSDREIIEYIRNKQRELQRQRVDKISFLIVSSEFSNSHSNENLLKDIFRATRVPVIFIRAKDLLYIVSKKLSNADINHAQLEDLFLDTGVLTTDKILDILG